MTRERAAQVRHRGLLFLVLLALVLVQRDVAGRLSFSFDEPVDLGAGLAAVTRGEIRLGPEHAPLPPLLAGIALRLGGAREGPAGAMVYAAIPPGERWRVAYQQEYAAALLYHDLAGFQRGASRPGASSVFALARLPTLGFALLLGAVTWCWARERHGALGAAVSLGLLATYPDFLGHMSLLGSDVPLAATGLTLGWLVARVQRRGGLGAVVGVGLAVAAALVTKLSGTFLVAALAGAALLAAAVPGGASDPAPAGVWHPCGQGAPAARARALGLALLVVAAVGAAAVSLAYLGREPVSAYAEALGSVYGNAAQGYLPLCLDRYGWRWDYFPIAFGLKAPLGTLALLTLSGWAALREPRLRGGWRDELLLHAPALGLFLVTVAQGIQAGSRYLLPVVVWLFVSAGRLGPWARGATWRRLLLGLLLGANLAGNLRDHPFHTSAFNLLAGDPRQAFRLLDDSNQDWGQGLMALAAWQARRGVPADALRVLGRQPWHDERALAAYGVAGRALSVAEQFAALARPEPGRVYAVSAHQLARFRLDERDAVARGEPPLTLGSQLPPSELVGGAFLIFDLR